LTNSSVKNFTKFNPQSTIGYTQINTAQLTEQFYNSSLQT